MIEYRAMTTEGLVPAEGKPLVATIGGRRVKLVLQYRYNRVPRETPDLVHYASGCIIASKDRMREKKLSLGALRGAKTSDREVALAVLADCIRAMGEERVLSTLSSAEVINK